MPVCHRLMFPHTAEMPLSSVLAQIYYFKPQTLSVSTLFLLVLSYWFGNGLAALLPSHGIFRWLNPGPFNSEFAVSSCVAVTAC